jgi:cbb3-type cytochrome oxidase subunit 1
MPSSPPCTTRRSGCSRRGCGAISEPPALLGWQGVIVAAAITLPLGLTQSKEYAELEWPVDIAIALVWVLFAVNFFGTVARRRERHLYVALWFYIATIVAITVLHVLNNLVVVAARSRATRSTPECRTRSCSGGTATMPSPSS